MAEREPASREELYTELKSIRDSISSLALQLERYQGTMREAITAIQAQTDTLREKVAANTDKVVLITETFHAETQRLRDYTTIEAQKLKTEVNEKLSNIEEDVSKIETKLDEYQKSEKKMNLMTMILGGILILIAVYLNWKWGVPVIPIP